MSDEYEIRDDEDWIDESQFDFEEVLEREDELHSHCECGAWEYSKKQGHYIKVADCICGNGE